jgi:hypothetical protein
MIDEKTIVTVERLYNDLQEFRSALRKRYRPDSQVSAEDLRIRGARIAETWLVEIACQSQVTQTVQSECLGDLNVHFQRILTFSEHATKRSRYDYEINGIQANFTAGVTIPLKQEQQSQPGKVHPPVNKTIHDFRPTAFVGHSFDPADRCVVDSIKSTLEAVGIRVVTGERPEADRISDKVKSLIDDQYLFVGVFTRRDKIARKHEWTTSLWVIDEKAYAVAKEKKLILLKEKEVGSIGGIQGDYEYKEFSRAQLDEAIVWLLRHFDLAVKGLQA